MITYYMMNYYIKYLELVDTVFLVLKKKPLGEQKITVCGELADVELLLAPSFRLYDYTRL